MDKLRADFVFCDDIRKEDNGKQILIGVYPFDLVPFSLPTQFSICIWCRVYGLEEGAHKLNAEISLNGSAINHFEINSIVSDPSKHVQINLMAIPVHIVREGELSIRLTNALLGSTEAGRLQIGPVARPITS
jgi:hypothetical protein